MSSVEIEALEARLRRPEGDENGAPRASEELTRLEALARLHTLAMEGQVQLAPRRGGINTHIHTSKSFAFFASPAEAVWLAYRSGLTVLGINDHYTLSGHEEFRQACDTVGLRPMFSLEAVARWGEAEDCGATVNDPANPGRTYLTAKGVTRAFPAGCQGEADLRQMNAALRARNQEMTRKMAVVFHDRIGIENALEWKDILAQTPHDQPTERHIAQVAATRLAEYFPEESSCREAATCWLGEEVSLEVLRDPAALQNRIRARLLKAGCPAFVEESEEAFIPVERMVSLALDLGAVPTYPVLGNPITPWEADLELLYDRIEALGIHAIEVIPDRNTHERLQQIVVRAAARGFPILNGTEHNTKSPAPLVDKFFFEPEFRPHFELGARVLLGHQALCAAGDPGFVGADGRVPSSDRKAHLLRVAAAAPA